MLSGTVVRTRSWECDMDATPFDRSYASCRDAFAVLSPENTVFNKKENTCWTSAN